MGDEVDVAVHRDPTAYVVQRVGGTPCFSKNCWVDAKSQGGIGGIRHNFIFRKELAGWIKQHAPYDWVCALTMRLQHLLAFALLSKFSAVPEKTHFFLLFVQGFGIYSGHAKPTVFPNNASTKLARFCFWLMAPAVRSGRVVLAAETKGMQDELQRFTGLPVHLAPHPVEFQLSRVSRVEGQGQYGTQELQSDSSLRSQVPSRDSHPTATPSVPLVHPVATSRAYSTLSTLDSRPSTQSLTITCPGFARHEKGTDLFQDAIRIILSRPDADRFRFILQWPDPFAMPDGEMLGPDLTLLSDPRVEFLNQNLSSSEYASLLERSDFILLPYRRNSYHHRVSRVAIEAAGYGIPIIYTKGTWSEEVAELAECGVPIMGESAREVADAILQATESFSGLKNKAIAGASRVVGYHSVQTFRKILHG
jgi:glycosyltransferase involved in cell wall biosynthesis